MAKTTPNPYVQSAGPLVQTIKQFMKSMPAKVDAATLKKLSLAPNNESTMLALLRFLGFIDNDGNKTASATKVFTTHGDEAFSKALETVVKKSYAELFELHGDGAWKADRDTLITFFRASDETSEITGKRQTIAFETLAALSGHGEVVQAKPEKKKVKTIVKKKAEKTNGKKSKSKADNGSGLSFSGENNVGLTVRIEINLPAQGDQETYDRIFKSIKKNLLNG